MSELPPEETLALLDEIVIGSARGGRKLAGPLTMEVVRSLTRDDLPLLANPPPVAAAGTGILEIRHQHHMIAQSIAEGHMLEHTALITGYSTAYISNLKNDPAFHELLAYYQVQKEKVFIDVAERMKNLGLATLDELQHRLAGDPDDWTKRELMELAELMMIKGRGAPAGLGSGSAPGGTNISVTFVSPSGPDKLPSATLDITPRPG